MWPIWILVALSSLAGFYLVENQIGHPEVIQARGDDLAVNMAVYRSAVIGYVSAHPAFNGSVDDANLQLPSWYRQQPWWRNIVVSGTVTVYADMPPLNFVGEIARLSGNSIWAGQANAATGTLYSPAFGDTGIVLPAGVPDQAAVWMAKIN